MPRRKPISPTVAPMYADSREPAASTSSTSPGGAPSADDTNTIAPTYASAEDRPGRARATPRSPSARAATGPYQRSHAARRSSTRRSPMPRDAHLLAGRRGGGGHEEVARQAVACGAPRSSAARSTPGRQVDVSTVGSANSGEQRERRVDRHEQRERDAEPQDPAAGREQRHVHVVEHEHLVAQHDEPVEVVGPLVVLDASRPRPAAAPRATRARSSPGRGSGAARASLTTRRNQVAVADSAEPDGRGRARAAVAAEHAVGEQLEPQREQRVGQRREQRQPERDDAAAAARPGSRA